MVMPGGIYIYISTACPFLPEKKIKKYGGPAGSAPVQFAGMKCRDLKGYKRRNTKW